MTRFAAIAIGRNEGERLKQCLRSLGDASPIIYVDSGSTDGSADWAHRNGIDVVQLDLSLPFTAARARNAGFRRLRELASGTDYVQFVDGDCELNTAWPATALAFLEAHQKCAAVTGRRRERYPERSIYNWMCDLEWNAPAGETRAFGGDVMIRAAALQAVGGYRDDLIAGEEPELSVRMRAAGWQLWRLDAEMTLHDAAMTRFSQWWHRIVRSGYAFAEGAHLHGAPPERHWVWESRRAWLWGAIIPAICLVLTLAFPAWGWILWLLYLAQFARQTLRNSGSFAERARLALFQMLARFAEAWGQVRFMRDLVLGHKTQLIEYK